MVDLLDIFAIVNQEVVQTYQYLHQNPELGFEEKVTSAYIAKKLREYGLEVIENVAITGVVGVLDTNKEGKTLMLRADMDALPINEQSGCEFSSLNEGRMHACGHDAHVAMLLGAAKYLSQNKHLFCGKVKFVFQPAEEGCSNEHFAALKELNYDDVGGSGLMIKQGVLDGVDGCFAIHCNPNEETGNIYISEREAMASSDKFAVTIIGKGGHGAEPYKAIDPIGALSQLIAAYHMLPAREINATETCVVSVGTVNTLASAWNVIPERIEVTGNIRTFSEDIRMYLLRRMKEIGQGIAEANRCTFEFVRLKGYNPTVNSSEMVALAKDTAEKVLGKEHVIVSKKPFMSSEDVGNYFRRVPGALIWLGVADPKCSERVPLHNPKFKVDLNALAYGVLVHVNNTIAFLT